MTLPATRQKILFVCLSPFTLIALPLLCRLAAGFLCDQPSYLSALVSWWRRASQLERFATFGFANSVGRTAAAASAAAYAAVMPGDSGRNNAHLLNNRASAVVSRISRVSILLRQIPDDISSAAMAHADDHISQTGRRRQHSLSILSLLAIPCHNRHHACCAHDAAACARARRTVRWRGIAFLRCAQARLNRRAGDRWRRRQVADVAATSVLK